MQTLTRNIYSVASLLLVLPVCNATEEHLMVDRLTSSVTHFAEAAPPPSLIVANQPNPWSVVWDAESKAVYWTELTSGAIWRKYPDQGLAEKAIYSSSNAVLRGLVLDSAQNTLYFLDSEAGTLNALNVFSLISTSLVSDLQRPNDMVLDRVNHALFFTDSGMDAVMRHDLDTHTTTTILSGPGRVGGAWGIDVVPETDCLYLSDYQTNAIMRADLSGSNLVVLVSGQETPRGLCVDRHHGRIYWLEAESGTLRSAGLDGSAPQVVLTNAAVSPRDLASYDSLDQDNDFLNDDWERFYFDSLSEGPYDDADADGVDSFTEQAFGSNPNDMQDAGTGTTIAYTAGTGPSLKYYLRTDEWMNYEILHSPDLISWSPVTNYTETMFLPDLRNGAVRTIEMDAALLAFGMEHFFKIEVQR